MQRRKLYTVGLGRITPSERTDAIDAFAERLRKEFPAYRVSTWTKADESAALVIATDNPKADFRKLDGWGTSKMLLAEVAEVAE